MGLWNFLVGSIARLYIKISPVYPFERFFVKRGEEEHKWFILKLPCRIQRNMLNLMQQIKPFLAFSISMGKAFIMVILRLPLSLRRRVAVGAALLLPVVLSGCGGSSNSSSAVSTPAANVPAVISRYGSVTDYSISLRPSGSVTYNQSRGITSEPTQTGTVSSALTAQFFKDLTVAMPVQNLPIFTGTTSEIAAGETVQYQGQTGHIDDPNDAREVALASDATAITQALGIPQN